MLFRSRIPPELDPILQRLDCVSGVWVDLVRNFRRRFRTEAGRPESLRQVRFQRRQFRLSGCAVSGTGGLR